MTRSSHKLSLDRSAVRGEFIHADLCCPMEQEEINGERYFLLLKDEASNFRYV